MVHNSIENKPNNRQCLLSGKPLWYLYFIGKRKEERERESDITKVTGCTLYNVHYIMSNFNTKHKLCLSNIMCDLFHSLNQGCNLFFIFSTIPQHLFAIFLYFFYFDNCFAPLDSLFLFIF